MRFTLKYMIMVLAFMAFPAFAQVSVPGNTVTAPEATTSTVSAPSADTVIAAPSGSGDTNVSAPAATTIVSIPTKTIVEEILDYLSAIAVTLVVGILGFLARGLPKALQDFLRGPDAQAFIKMAVEYGIGLAKGATNKLDSWDVNVGSDVLAGALQFIVNHAPQWVIDWAGGKEKIKALILAEIAKYLKPDITSADIDKAVAMPVKA